MRESKPKFNTLQLGDVAIAIISAKWNSDYNNEMLESAEAALVESGIAEDKLDIFEVPGAFEIPYLAKKLAETMIMMRFFVMQLSSKVILIILILLQMNQQEDYGYNAIKLTCCV